MDFNYIYQKMLFYNKTALHPIPYSSHGTVYCMDLVRVLLMLQIHVPYFTAVSVQNYRKKGRH